MNKEFYDKYSNGLKCYGCDYLLQCKKANRPILAKCIPNMNYVDKIIGLESKLAESEKEKQHLKDFIDKRENCNEWLTMKDNENLQYEVNKLKQQLAEEKNRNKKLNHEAQKYYEDAYCNGFQNKKAIEELERLKEFVKNNALVATYQNDYGGYNETEPYVPKEDLLKKLDQQINELKGGAVV